MPEVRSPVESQIAFSGQAIDDGPILHRAEDGSPPRLHGGDSDPVDVIAPRAVDDWGQAVVQQHIDAMAGVLGVRGVDCDVGGGTSRTRWVLAIGLLECNLWS